jgi:hypothetical protein
MDTTGIDYGVGHPVDEGTEDEKKDDNKKS